MHWPSGTRVEPVYRVEQRSACPSRLGFAHHFDGGVCRLLLFPQVRGGKGARGPRRPHPLFLPGRELHRARAAHGRLPCRRADATHVEPYEARRLKVSYVFGRRGSCAQRNDALDRALPRADVITFIVGEGLRRVGHESRLVELAGIGRIDDDDFLPADDYLQVVCDLFAAHPDWAVVTGRVVHDGVHSGGTSFADGLARLRLAQAGRPSVLAAEDRVGAYGCNMSIRSAMIGDNRFDERLVHYGWQEDIDFSSRLRRQGRITSASRRGASAACVSATRRSQIPPF